MTTRTTTERFAPKDVARAGAIMPIDYDGDISVMRGRVRAEDLGEPDSGSRAPSPPLPSPPLPYRCQGPRSRCAPASLVADLTAHRTAALRLEMVRQPAVALAATVHALALALIYPVSSGAGSCLALRASSEDLARHVRKQTIIGACRLQNDRESLRVKVSLTQFRWTPP